MKVLVIAQQGQTRDALEKQFKIRTRPHHAVDSSWLNQFNDLPTGKATRLLDGFEVVVSSYDPDAVCHDRQDALVEHLDHFAAVCEARGLPIVQLSDSRVFDGLEGGVHKELEAAVSASESGKLLARIEGVVSARCERHIVLRSGPLFSSVGNNLLTDLLSRFEEEETLALSDQGESCPIHASDLARVVSGVIDQLSCGAEVWGTYHYASADYVTHYQFAEALWKAVSQYKKAVSRVPKLEPADRPEPCWQFPLLNCERVLNTFGIKQLPWRAFLAPTVKKFFDPDVDASEPVLTQSIQPVQKENFDG